MRIPRRPGPCLVFSIKLGSSYLPLGAVAVVEVIGEDAPVIRIHLPSFLLNATCSCEPLKAACFTSLGVRGSLTSITSPFCRIKRRGPIAIICSLWPRSSPSWNTPSTRMFLA